MVSGWRRAFCTTISRDRQTTPATDKQQQQQQQSNNSLPSPKLSGKFRFFSNPSTPRLQTQQPPQPVPSPSLRCRTTATVTTPAPSLPDSPKLQCKTTADAAATQPKNSPRFFQRSNPSSPRTPSSFSLLKASLRLSKSRCGICLQGVKTGQGTAIFTAECSHAFHFPCVAAHVRKQGSLVCPVCSAQWKEVPLLAVHKNEKSEVEEHRKMRESQVYRKQYKPSDLKVYDDDEPLMSPAARARFNPIPESDENDDENGEVNGSEEFQGFFVSANEAAINTRNVEVKLLQEAAVVSVGRGYEIYAVVLKLKAPPSPAASDGKTSSLLNPARRAPIDLVTVLDVSENMTGAKLQMMKRAMRLVISSLSTNDRLSIVAFSAPTKRLLPLRRMTTTGKRSARRIVDALGTTGQGTGVGDALRKAAKVLEDRRERNPIATIMLLSDGQDERGSTKSSNQNRPSPGVSSTRFAHMNIPVQSFGFGDGGSYGHAPPEDAFAKCVSGLLSVVVQDLRLQLGFSSGSAPAEIAAVYSCTGRPTMLGSGSIRIGDLYAEEERELLIELKVPTSAVGSHLVLAVRSTYKDPSSQDIVHTKEQALLVPRPHAVRSSDPNIERLRNLFLTNRAVAESRRLVDRNDLSGAHRLLSAARALLMQSSNSTSADEFLRGLESELAELHWRRQQQQQQQQQQMQMLIQRQRPVGREGAVYVDEKGEPLTPTSAWRAAERLAKVAIMRKSLNRVSDLHGFENARF
ncbi:hypothetical protein L1049_025025 [Liquidambar formosana]|uniref:RING-type E3 ubiquitin transferase n=1 Tax=Liquidambar formosana TaxID=63359 RepID=A0AAP0RWZ3_LIQFO